MTAKPRILIVDDHAIVRKGMMSILQDQGPYECREAGTGEEAVALASVERFDMVLMDINLPGCNGLEALEAMHARRPGLPVLMLSLLPESQYALRALRMGASGFVGKSSSPEEILAAIRRVLGGKRFVSDSIAQILVEESANGGTGPRHQPLSNREFEVMRCIGSGQPTGEIATRLGISAKTVGTYRDRLMEKMAFANNAELIRYCLREGLLD